jgi:hypothetical protein
MFGAEPRRHLAEREIARGREREQGDLAVEHGEVDVAAAVIGNAAGEPRQDRDRHPESRGQIGDRQAGLDRRSATLSGQAHDAAHGLEDGVIALAMRQRPALPEAGAGDVDDARVDAMDRGIVEAVALERADRKVLEEHIGLPRELADNALAVGRAQIDGDRLLAAITGEIVGALGGAVARDERLEAACLVAAIGFLDLDHRRAELGQDHARERAGEHPRQVEDGHVLERFHRAAFRACGTRACAC